jgi:hypothetical protein
LTNVKYRGILISFTEHFKNPYSWQFRQKFQKNTNPIAHNNVGADDPVRPFGILYRAHKIYVCPHNAIGINNKGEMRMELLKPTNDYVFKRIFGYIGNEDITKDFLNSIMDEEVTKVKLDCKEILEQDLQDDKFRDFRHKSRD